MKSKVQIGLEGEIKAMGILGNIFDELFHIGGISPYDIIAKKGAQLYGINVKTGKTGFTMSKNNLIALLKGLPSVIPSFFLIYDDYACFFSLKEEYSIIPDADTSTSKTKLYINEDSIYADFVNEVKPRGRITIPQTIRSLLGLKDGDIVKIGDVQKITKEAEV